MITTQKEIIPIELLVFIQQAKLNQRLLQINQTERQNILTAMRTLLKNGYFVWNEQDEGMPFNTRRNVGGNGNKFNTN